MHLVFNELSLCSISNDKDIGGTIFEKFLKTYSSAIKENVGFSRDIITAIDLNSIEISEGYFVSEWRNQRNVDKDLQMLFKRMCDRQRVESVNDNDSEITCDKGSGKGLLIAYQNDMTIISLDNDAYWSSYYIKCEYYNLELDESAAVVLRNICSISNINNNMADILQRKKSSIISCATPNELFERVESMFPSLIFHKVALDQIKYQLEKQHVSVVCKKLMELEQYFVKWDGKVFEEGAFPNRSVSPESKETLREFRKEHTFEFEDNIKVLVSYHIRYTGNIPGRIYFYPDNELKKARICSLTTKLPTVKYPKGKI